MSHVLQIYRLHRINFHEFSESISILANFPYCTFPLDHFPLPALFLMCVYVVCVCVCVCVCVYVSILMGYVGTWSNIKQPEREIQVFSAI